MPDASDTSDTVGGVEPSISVEFVDSGSDGLGVINFPSGRRLVKGGGSTLLTEDELKTAAEAGVELNIDRSNSPEPVPATNETPWKPAPQVDVSGGVSPEVKLPPSPGQ
jgi:hypothetical protein